MTQIKSKKTRVMTYKNPEIYEILDKIPLFKGMRSHKVGEIVRFKNNSLAQVIKKRNSGRKALIFISSKNASNLTKLIYNQRMKYLDWPKINSNNFSKQLKEIFSKLNYIAPKNTFVNKEACDAKSFGKIKLGYYQKIVSSYLIYGPYRGLLAWHGLGSGKTCTSIDVLNSFILKIHLNNEFSSRIYLNKDKDIMDIPISPEKIYVVIPPVRSLEENYRNEVSKTCPSVVKEFVENSQLNKDGSKPKRDPTNRVINKYIKIISYVSLSNRVKKGQIKLDNALFILDESHNLLYPPSKYKDQYNYLVNKLKEADKIKILLLTATPIFKSITDLTKLVNIMKHKSEKQLPETLKEFNQRYYNIFGNLKKSKLSRDIQGYISYYDIEDDISYFARKKIMAPILMKVDEEHYKKWQKTFKNESKRYNIKNIKEIYNPNYKNEAFTSGVSGYFKRSSAMSNLPSSYSRQGLYPKKFHKLLKIIKKYPKQKHFIISRHKSAGANGIGFFLETQGWTRLSNNKNDHGTKRPVTKVKIATKLNELNEQFKLNKITLKTYSKKRQELFDNFKGAKYNSFVIFNSTSTAKAISEGRAFFNTKENVDGKYCRIFIGDEKFSEGVSLSDTLHVHIFEPFYSKQGEKQAIARAVRRCSHKRLSFKNRIVRIHQYYNVKDIDWFYNFFKFKLPFQSDNEENFMVDNIIDKYSEKKQEVLQKIIDSSIQSAIEN